MGSGMIASLDLEIDEVVEHVLDVPRLVSRSEMM